MITKGVYKPSDRIVETKLAKELGVSQAPVREAILELVMMGMLEDRPYSGTYVRKLSPEDIEDIYEIRAMVEEHAAKNAAVHIKEPQMDELTKELGVMRDAAEKGDIEQFVDADIRFHEIVVDTAKSKSLKRIWRFLRMADWTYTTTQLTPYSLYDLCDMHETIYKHLKSRNGLSAAAAMHLHIMEFAGDVIQSLQAKEPEKDR
jgi:DNA-binding GntR family transcriptional regulator